MPSASSSAAPSPFATIFATPEPATDRDSKDLHDTTSNAPPAETRTDSTTENIEMPGAAQVPTGTRTKEEMTDRCYNCGNDPGLGERCETCGAVNLTAPIGMFSTQGVTSAQAATPAATSPTGGFAMTTPETPSAADPGAPSTWSTGGASAADPGAPSTWSTGGASRPPSQPARPVDSAGVVRDDDVVDATVIDDEPLGQPPAPTRADPSSGRHAAPPTPPPTPPTPPTAPTSAPAGDTTGNQHPLGSVFDGEPTRSRSEPTRSPFARFANDEAPPENPTNRRWSIDETDEPTSGGDDHDGAGVTPEEHSHTPSRLADAEPGSPPSRPSTPPSAFAGLTDTSTSAFPTPKSHAPSRPVAPDRHGLSRAVSRLNPSSQAAGGAGFTVLGALLTPGETIDQVVVGTSLGMPTVAALTGQRVIVISEKRWVPEVEIFTIGDALTVHGRHANNQASLTFGDNERLVTVDQISEVSIAVELATTLRGRTSGTEF